MEQAEITDTLGTYQSWTHDPRGTTHDTSGKRSWWWRSSRRSILPPAGCREEVFWCSQSWKRGGSGIEVKITMRGSLRGFSERGVNIGQRGALGGSPSPRRPGGATRRGAL